ncbi:GreA/GreB family elongation factor [Pseudonocardia bannensis]|uniref:Nucleoside diphosphate kinase regulator n=1 Tax=Pseudonocardia bannensis TaxID=630973 RepID=A0A848DFZ7_9PSEU|nr:GreA/GreB family elongation factor [Pseudonocardia bannensis]NMH91463.1 nucleoside diphosphate kinase regulator [Pseudonocardia bannensis]
MAETATTGPGHDERHALLDEIELLRARRHVLEQDLEVDDEPKDFGEQGETTQRRDEIDYIDRRIRDILHLLHSVPRDPADTRPDRVGIGSVVTLRYPDGTTDTVQVVAVRDEDVPEVTPDSPLGRALLGAAKGDEISWGAPEGRLRARIEEIRRPA